MRSAQARSLAFTALFLPLACAAGSESPAIDPGVVTTQSTGDDAGLGIGANDAGSAIGNVPVVSDDAGAASEDAGSPAPSNDASSPPSEDAGAPPPPVVDSAAPPPPVVDAGAPVSACPGYALPDVTAGCTCDPTKHTCTANGCYNGYYCELSGTKCVPKPAGC